MASPWDDSWTSCFCRAAALWPVRACSWLWLAPALPLRLRAALVRSRPEWAGCGQFGQTGQQVELVLEIRVLAAQQGRQGADDGAAGHGAQGRVGA